VNKSRAKWLALVALVAGSELASLPVWAQSTELEEVVVTARKRDESFHDVPITVDAFTAQTIQAAGIEAPRDFVALVPNMTMVEVQNVGNSFITIRGISQARNSEPSVAVLVDGVLETNPYEFNQDLFDVKQIEVLKGPQGALYGRNAIGGAILIHTADPSDHFEGVARVGVGNGTSEKGQLALSGPLDSAGTLRYRASLSYYNTDGFLHNTYLNTQPDPLRDYTARLRLQWKPSDELTADLRFLYDRVETTAYYYIIPRSDEANIFTTFSTPPNANDVTSPIQGNNLGSDNRDILDTALKLDYNVAAGTFTSITDYNQTKEIDTGDAYDFRPVTASIGYNLFFAGIPAALGGPLDESQSQFIRVRAWSQELRFTSNKVGGFSWIAGAYFVHTERFISTGNLVDRGMGIPPVYETPIVDPTNPFATNTNVTFLADSQNNNAWALFADATYDFNAQWELDAAIRYDEDTRNNTTDTPTVFLPKDANGNPAGVTGQVRTQTWSEPQPKATLRYKPTNDVTIYGGWARGFRSGGFNQTGVGAVAAAEGLLGVHDTFGAEVADTWEIGTKTQWLDRRLSANLALFHTDSHNGYFFAYEASTSTQNLGNLDATYKGGELELSARATDQLDLYASFGYTDSKITAMEDPRVIGNQAPLVTRTSVNAGAQWRQPISGNLTGTVRLDYQQIGRTWWDPFNVTSRDPVNLLDLRLGLQGDKWNVTAWSKNLTNTIYNAEFSPGAVPSTALPAGGSGFLWRAYPRRYGIDFEYRF
jgi:iron complex outermembrane receptor protein